MIKKSYQGIIFTGATFPDDPYRHILVKIDGPVLNEYLPAFDRALVAAPRGMKLLLAAMTDMEGFRPGTRSYENNNPGNIGNLDNGVNKRLLTLEAGIQMQASFIKGVAAGTSHHYPMNVEIHIDPFPIPGAAHMGLPSVAPGYIFTFTGQLDQFIKIYSTGARCTNVYSNQIVSYFADNGLTISATSKLADIIAMN